MEILMVLTIAAVVTYGFLCWEEQIANRRALQAIKFAAQRDMDSADVYHEMRCPGYADTLMRICPSRTIEQHKQLMGRAHPVNATTRSEVPPTGVPLAPRYSA